MTERKKRGQQQAQRSQNDLVYGSNSRGLFLSGLRDHRLLAALSQQQLAKIAGIHQSAISELENCKRAAFPQTVRRLCAVLNVKPFDLICKDHEGMPSAGKEALGTSVSADTNPR
jgi:transcriptional regulator with XRE-family HTH domain